MPDNNPYVTVNGPDYGAGLMNWQALMNQGQQQQQQKPQPQSAQPASTSAQRPSLASRLQQWLGIGGQQPGAPLQLNPPQMPPQSAQGPVGLY